MNVYATEADLQSALGVTGAPATDRHTTAVINGSRWVDYHIGNSVTEELVVAPYTVSVVPCPPSWRAAAIAAAVRFFKAPDVPFGVMQAGEYGMSVKSSIPEAELLLRGQRLGWGIA